MTCKYFKPYMKTLKKIVEGFYEMDGCGAGGPLHILLDDDNYDIDSINWSIKYCFDVMNDNLDYPVGYSDTVCALGIMICNEYAKMSLEERATFDAYLHDESVECTIPEACDGCHIREYLYDFMKEKEELYNAEN